MNSTNIASCILCSILLTYASAQETNTGNSKKPEVGYACPDFGLTRVTHYSKKQVSLADFRGKWLFLDFWFTGCTSCINSLPKISQLQEQFQDKIQFLLIGINDRKNNSNIELLFEKLAKKQQLNIASAYDSILAAQWEIYTMPHIVIIDPQGIVKHITNGRDMNYAKIKDLVEGKTVSFQAKDIIRSDFGADDHTLSKRSGDETLIYRSVLTRWNGEKQNSGYPIDAFVLNYPQNLDILRQGWSVAMIPLYGLYNYAYLGRWIWTSNNPDYYGNVYHKPILQMQDSSLFIYDYQFELGKGTYNYNLTLPPEKVTKEYLMQEIQTNLKSAFGYEVSIEMRLMPVWNLVVSAGHEKKLITKGGHPDNGVIDSKTGNRKSIAAGFRIQNQSVPFFLSLLTHIIGEKDLTPFLDKTGINSNIDIEIEADLTSFEDIRKSLHRYGLDLVKGVKEMKIIIIRD
jgi:thiol-disulfide isomerase/thioredoxin